MLNISSNIKIGFLWVLLPLFVSCTDIREILSIDGPSIEDLNPHDIKGSLAVINLDVNQDEYNHMYDNFTEEHSVRGLFSIFRPEGQGIENHDVIIQIKGGVSSALPLKSMEVRFPVKLDNKENIFINPLSILPIHTIDEIETIRLRNSGNDFTGTMIKDISYTQLAISAGLDIDLMYAEQAVVFVNNRFLGLMNIRTESNTRGIAGLYGIDRSQITMAKIDKCVYGGCTEVRGGDSKRVEDLLSAITNKDLEYLYNEVDVSNFIDYIIFQTYISNTDWPYNNVRFFATPDSKFRFFVFDLDMSSIFRLNRDHHSIINTPLLNPVRDLFNIFYSEEEFRQQFYSRYTFLLQSGKLSSEKFREITNYYYKNIEEVMAFQIGKYNEPSKMVEWYKNIELLNHNFALRESLVHKMIPTDGD